MYNVEGIFDYRMCLWGLELVVELKCKKLALFGGVENTLEHWVLVLAGGDRRVIFQRLSPAYKALVSIFISAVKRSIGSTTGFHNHGEGPY